MEYLALVASITASITAYFMYFNPTSHKTSHLFEDGYEVIVGSDVLNVQNAVKTVLGENYTFLNYKYIIKGTVLPTFHRDVTSGQRYCGTKYPTYTAIQYMFDGDFLTVCPNSHLQYPFALTKPRNISGKNHNIVLFNSDVLHAGMPNKVGDSRIAHQYKIVHIDDLIHMYHLQGIQVTKEKEAEIMSPWLTWGLRQSSFHAAFFVSVMLPSCLRRRHTTGILHHVQNLMPLSFYNNI